MRLRHITGCEAQVAASPYVIHDPAARKGAWKSETFSQGKEIHLEIGMGKGQFITQLAARNQEICYIGIERYDTVLLKALGKREKLEEEGVSLRNLSYMSIDAKELPEIFAPGEVDRIYLNFSDPWPKDRHAKRRLTSPEFMKIYDLILKRDGIIEFKTDNRGLFDYSVETIPQCGWTLSAVSYDLHHDPAMNEGNVMTEYEEKFSAKGNPIYKLIARR